MNKAEVAKLMLAIKQNYPSFDASAERVDWHLKYLNDFPFDVAMSNVHQHILTEKFPPNIAEIRGRLGEQIERDELREKTQSHYAQLALWKEKAAPPPDDLRRLIHGL